MFVRMSFGNVITITLRHQFRLELFLNMQCNYLCYACSVFEAGGMFDFSPLSFGKDSAKEGGFASGAAHGLARWRGDAICDGRRAADRAEWLQAG